MLSGLANFGVIEVHHSISLLHHPGDAPKNNALMKENDTSSVAIARSGIHRPRVSPRSNSSVVNGSIPQ
jgi:hypothetical protein